VEDAYSIGDEAALRAYPHKTTPLFELQKLPHRSMDTFDFVSVPVGIGTLSFREKQLEYFPGRGRPRGNVRRRSQHVADVAQPQLADRQLAAPRR